MKSFIQLSNQGINRVLLWPINIIDENKYTATDINSLYLHMVEAFFFFSISRDALTLHSVNLRTAK